MINFALFITAYESFKARVIDMPSGLFLNGFDENGPILDSAYEREVLSLAKSPLEASLQWFLNSGAIDEADIEVANEARRHRNELAHELPRFLTEASSNLNTGVFDALIALLTKIERWWVLNFEAAVNPGMVPEGSTAEDIMPGSIWSFELMRDIAKGTEPEEGFYYENFKKSGI